MPQLDALRFLTILAVLVDHNWRPGDLPWIFSGIRLGDLGVRLFFVLSGFLITGILLRGWDAPREHRAYFVRQFYVRRFLRIFPAYYLVVLVAVAFGAGEARRVWPWLVTYTTNAYVFAHDHWIGNVSSLWSLAVQEQFYLVWPLLLLFLPRRVVLPVLLLAIAAAPSYRLFESFHYPPLANDGDFVPGVLTLGVVDSLAFGALLALLARAGVVRRLRLPFALGAGGLVALLALRHYGVDRHALVTSGDTCEALAFCALIAGAARGFPGAAGLILESRLLRYLGKRSYGIYLYHVIVPTAFRTAARNTSFVPYAKSGFLFFCATTLVTIGAAALSWRVFEGRLNGLKRHFPYAPQARDPLALRGSVPARAS
jgi:peptidoglycan/LPS O-acetylase OafA/YrhL